VSLLVARNPAEDHAAFVDAYSFGKLGFGMLAGMSSVSETWFMVGVIAFEAIQNGAWFERTTPPESAMNQLGDIAFGVLGYALGAWLRANTPTWIGEVARLMDPQVPT
jgi:hypothetical protein